MFVEVQFICAKTAITVKMIDAFTIKKSVYLSQVDYNMLKEVKTRQSSSTRIAMMTVVGVFIPKLNSREKAG